MDHLTGFVSGCSGFPVDGKLEFEVQTFGDQTHRGLATASFVYDGDGNRVKASTGLTTTVFVGSYYEVELPDTLNLTVESRCTAGHGYTYRIFDNTTTYTIQAGDTLEFDVYLDPSNPTFQGGFDAMLGSWTVRDTSGWVDQNNIGIHPANSLNGRANGQWYHRVFSIGNKAGQVLSNFKIAHEGDAAGVYLIKLDNIVIKNGGATRQVIYQTGFPLVSLQAEGPTAEIASQSLYKGTSYYFAGGQRVGLRRAGYVGGSGLFFLLSDQLGSTSVTTRMDGSKFSEQLYKPWGEVRYSSGTMPTKYTYTGQYSYATGATGDFGLMFYGARWYDSYVASYRVFLYTGSIFWRKLQQTRQHASLRCYITEKER